MYQSGFNPREQNLFKPFNQKMIYCRLLNDLHNHRVGLKNVLERASRSKSQSDNVELSRQRSCFSSRPRSHLLSWADAITAAGSWSSHGCYNLPKQNEYLRPCLSLLLTQLQIQVSHQSFCLAGPSSHPETRSKGAGKGSICFPGCRGVKNSEGGWKWANHHIHLKC